MFPVSGLQCARGIFWYFLLIVFCSSVACRLLRGRADRATTRAQYSIAELHLEVRRRPGELPEIPLSVS